MSRYTIEQKVQACCLSAVGLALAGRWLLSRPKSWLSRRVDRAVTWPVAR